MTFNPVRRPDEARGTPLRIRPSAGPARCVLEHVGQHVWRYRLAWYIATVTVLAFSLQFAVKGSL